MLRVLKPYHYLEARTVKEAIEMLSVYGTKAKILAGGTDLLLSMKRKKISPECIVYIKNSDELNYTDYNQKTGLTIGAATTLESVISNPIVKKKFGILASACSKVGTPQIRNMGTIGGNLCQDTKCLGYWSINPTWDVPCYRDGGDTCYVVKRAKKCEAMAIAETAPALICMDAKASISGPNGGRTTHIEKFFVSSGVVDLRKNEILSGIEIPNLPPDTAGTYLRQSMRGHVGFALASVAVVLTIKNGVCKNSRLALLGVSRKPMRARKAEKLLNEERIKKNLIDHAASVAAKEAHPLGDIFGSASYRRQIVKALTRRALREVIQRIG